jgi:hypothetical protein
VFSDGCEGWARELVDVVGEVRATEHKRFVAREAKGDCDSLAWTTAVGHRGGETFDHGIGMGRVLGEALATAVELFSSGGAEEYGYLAVLIDLVAEVV